MSRVTAYKHVTEPLSEEIDAIFREHSRLVYSTAYTVTGSAHDAEDVLQTLFLELLRRGLPARFNENPQGYLYRASVNLALNAVKARKRRASAMDPAHLELAVDDMGDTDQRHAGANRCKRLLDAMAQLHPRWVEMLVLRYQQNRTEAEIGALLGTSRGVVAVTLFRARRRLKTLLRPSAGEEAS